MKKTLLLSQEQIKKLFSMKEAIKVVEKAFLAYGKNEVRMPSKIYLDMPEYNGDYRAMPGFIKSLNACGIKWVCVYPNNKKFGLPTVMAVIILSDTKNAYPVAILDGTYITDVRTGVAGAVASKYLAKKSSKVLALIGCGVQAKFQLLALKEIFKFEKINLYDINCTKIKSFCEQKCFTGIKFIPTSSIKECVKDADIICTCTTSTKPLVKYSWLKKGVHINAIGADAPGKQELFTDVLKNAKVVVDDIHQAVHSGEVNVHITKRLITEKNIYANLGDIVAGKKVGRKNDSEITVFDSTGLAIQDISLAKYVYDLAIKNNSLNKKKVGFWIKII